MVLAAAGLGLTAGACGSDDPGGAAALVDGGADLVIANSAGTISTNGPQRVLVALLGDGDLPYVGGPDVPATFEFRSAGGSAAEVTPGRWVATEGSPLGLYVAEVELPVEGVWEVTVEGSDAEPTSFSVAAESAVPDIGDPAPRSDTPTAADVDSLAEISTDPEPEPAFYELSLADAVASGKPTVVVFATPAFCVSATCGPTIEIAKAVAADHPEIQFVHVEPFDIEQARNGTRVAVPAAEEWKLPTEPWVFVIDAEGKVAASFEGILGRDELGATLDAL